MILYESRPQEEILMKYWRRNQKAILATMKSVMQNNPQLGVWQVYHPDFVVTVQATPELMQRKETQKFNAKVKSIG